MPARRYRLLWTSCLLAGLTACPGCQYLSRPLAKLPTWNFRSSEEPARGPLGPMQASSFAHLKPTAAQKTEVQVAFARSVEREGDHQGAMKLYQQLIDTAPDHPAAYHRLAVLNDQAGNHLDALRYYREALKRDPQNADIYADRGYSFYLQNKWPAAEENFRQALQLDNTLARAHNNLGLLLARTGRQDEALMEFRLAGCSTAECRANLVHALMLDQRFGEARQQCEIVLASHDVPADVKQRLTQLHGRIADVQHRRQGPPPESQFLPRSGQAAAPQNPLAVTQQVSYQPRPTLRALPPVLPPAQ